MAQATPALNSRDPPFQMDSVCTSCISLSSQAPVVVGCVEVSTDAVIELSRLEVSQDAGRLGIEAPVLASGCSSSGSWAVHSACATFRRQSPIGASKQLSFPVLQLHEIKTIDKFAPVLAEPQQCEGSGPCLSHAAYHSFVFEPAVSRPCMLQP